MPRLFNRGFTLIEVLIAVGIIAVLIISTAAFLERVPINTREVRDQDLALRIARDTLEELRAAGYAALPSSGSFSHALLSSLASSTGSVTVTLPDAGIPIKQVSTSVSWRGTGDFMRSVSLTTLMTEIGGLP